MNSKWDLVEALVHDPELQQRPNGTTFCNVFVQKVSHIWCCYDLDGKTANIMMATLDGSPDWEEITPTKAQEEANAGNLVVVGSANPGGHGHVAVVIPGLCEYSNTLRRNVPKVANVGPVEYTFYNKKASFAFGKECVSDKRTLNFYVWRGKIK